MNSVVIISTANLYYGNSAAVARMNLYAKALALANIRVYLLSTMNFSSNEQWREVEKNIYTFSRKNLNEKRKLFYVLKRFLEIKKRIKIIEGDVVLLNYPGTSSILWDILVVLLHGNNRIYCEVNEVKKFASEYRRSLFQRLAYFMLEKTYKYYDGIIFISRHIKDYYKSSSSKNVVVPILSDCNRVFKPSTGLNTHCFVFVGTVSFSKENLDELLEGFLLFLQRKPSAKMHFYGYLSETDRRIFESFVLRTQSTESIVYMGSLQHSEVPHVLSSAGALILPRNNNLQNYYGFSTKLSEYAVSGAPIVLTNTGVVSDFFEDGVNCLMCQGYDRYSFLQKFEELALLTNEEKQKIAQNAFVVAHNCFDYRQYTPVLADFLFKD